MKTKKYLQSKNFFDLMALVFLIGFLLSYFPKEVLGLKPATGGDTGSHFFPLVTLVQEALPHFQIKTWNPGNLGGEPHLVHYFPLPYLVMAFFSLFVPLGMAFNLGTLLPIVVFPLCTYLCLRKLKLPFPVPILGAYASLASLLNESFSMWGGNALSLLAGQFAHLYALCFFLLGIGYLYDELSKNKWPVVATLLFAGVQLSHSYVALYLVIIYAVFLFFLKHLDFKTRFVYLFSSSIATVLLSAWFLFPMLNNAPWTTPFSLVWYSSKIIDEALPFIFRPYVVMLGLATCYLLYLSRQIKVATEVYFSAVLFTLIIAFSIGFYYLFPHLGLVDVRAFPQAQMGLVILTVIPVGFILRKVFKQYARVVLLVFFIGACLIGVQSQIKNLNYWMKWNYSGWETKETFKQVNALALDVRGSFSDPRIVYENNEAYTSMGTMRVFEMLPYFMKRSTLESVYMQASILAPMAFYIQALVSDRPSCPYREFPCPRIDLEKALPYLKLMGVGELLLSTEVAKTQARSMKELVPKTDYGMFQLYEIEGKSNLVEVVNSNIQWVEFKDYKKSFFTWFENLNPDQSLQIVDTNLELDEKITIEHSANGASTSSANGASGSVAKGSSNNSPGSTSLEECAPELKVQFNRLSLKTNCPGRLHQLRFAFHPTFKSTTGEKTYLLSPGFIGIIPESESVELVFGESILWFLSPLISWITLFGLLTLVYFQRSRELKNFHASRKLN